MPVVTVDLETKNKLLKKKTDKSIKEGKPVSFNDIINDLLNQVEEHEKKKIDK